MWRRIIRGAFDGVITNSNGASRNADNNSGDFHLDKSRHDFGRWLRYFGALLMPAELDNHAFQDDDLAREWFEGQIWPDGPVCPHCGSYGEGVTKLVGKKHRPGVYQCNACRKQFTVTIGTVMERSHIPLHIWLKAMFLLSASKKGMSTHQLHRMLGLSLKSTWFLMHRIREAMREPFFGSQMGGSRKPVQADEAFFGRTTSRAGEVRQRG
jgi:transposase-like protein